MTDVEFLRERVPGYAGYADHVSRHHTDQQIQSYLGEALAAARERLGPNGPQAEQLDGLLMRCEFTDQRLVRAEDHVRFGDALVERIHALDRQIVECAARLRDVDAAAFGATLDEAARLLDQRFGAIVDGPPA